MDIAFLSVTYHLIMFFCRSAWGQCFCKVRNRNSHCIIVFIVSNMMIHVTTSRRIHACFSGYRLVWTEILFQKQCNLYENQASFRLFGLIWKAGVQTSVAFLLSWCECLYNSSSAWKYTGAHSTSKHKSTSNMHRYSLCSYASPSEYPNVTVLVNTLLVISLLMTVSHSTNMTE